jgi:hypothetical protein
MNMKRYLICLVIVMFLPQVTMDLMYMDRTGDLYAIGYLLGMAAMWFSSRIK